MTNLELFAEIMKNDFYFSENVTYKNYFEWDDDKTSITIYNEDALEVKGIGSIGQAAELLNLCCTAYWDDERLQIRVH